MAPINVVTFTSIATTFRRIIHKYRSQGLQSIQKCTVLLSRYTLLARQIFTLIGSVYSVSKAEFRGMDLLATEGYPFHDGSLFSLNWADHQTLRLTNRFLIQMLNQVLLRRIPPINCSAHCVFNDYTQSHVKKTSSSCTHWFRTSGYWCLEWSSSQFCCVISTVINAALIHAVSSQDIIYLFFTLAPVSQATYGYK